jgi:solute:Na+ symporter, SSS family
MKVLSTADFITMVVYLIVILVVGLWASKKVKNQLDFFVGGRALGGIIIMSTVCASIVGGGAIIGRGGLTYNTGISAIMAAVPYMVGMYLFTCFAPRIREIGERNNISSLAELMQFRFNKPVAIFASALIIFTMVATVGTQVTATATVFRFVGGSWGITYEMGAWIAAIFFISYTVASGLYGVGYTDVIQFFVFVPILYIIVPLMVLSNVGGFAGLRAAIPAPEMWSIRPDAMIVAFGVTNFFFTMAGAEMWQRAFSAKSERTAFWGFFTGNTVYVFGTVIFTFIVAMGVKALYPNLIEQFGTADAAVPILVDILPVILGGLLIGSLLAVLMSSADTYLLMAGHGFMTLLDEVGLLTGNMKKQEALISRLILIVFGLCAVLFALYYREAYAALMKAWTFFAAAVGPAAVATLFWRKATSTGIMASMATGFVVSMAWGPLNLPLYPSFGGCISSVVVLIVVCLATYNPAKPSKYPECSEFWPQLKNAIQRKENYNDKTIAG